MDGLIDVRIADDGEALFTPRCGCGWAASGEAIIEMAELSILGHFDRAHRKTAAA